MELLGIADQSRLISSVHLKIRGHLRSRFTRFTPSTIRPADGAYVIAGVEGLEPHATNAFTIRNARNVVMRRCSAQWGEVKKEYYGAALEAIHVEGLKLEDFHGEAALPDRQKAIVIR